MKLISNLILLIVILLTSACAAATPTSAPDRPTASASLVPTLWPTHTTAPTPAPTENAQARLFGDALLLAIGTRPPDLTDSFDQQDGWHGFDELNTPFNIASVKGGVLMDASDGRSHWIHMSRPEMDSLRNFVLVVEAQFLGSGQDPRDRSIGLGWWPGDDLGERFVLHENGTYEAGTCAATQCPSYAFGHLDPAPAGHIYTLTLIHRKGESAVYVDGFPVVYHKLTIRDRSSGVALNPETNDGLPSQIAYDNLKIWNLEGLPGLP